MKKQRGFGFIHILLILLFVGISAVIWKSQQRQVTEQAKNKKNQEVAQKITEAASEQQHIAEINILIEESRRKTLELQRRVYTSIKKEPEIPDQSDMTSKFLPYLTWKATPIDMTKAEIKELANEVRIFIAKSLKDSDSAKFSDMRIFKAIHSDGEFTFICGKVNAKNSYGGYVGFQDYIAYRRESKIIEGGIGDNGFLTTIRSDGKWWSYDGDDMCLTYGFPIKEDE